LVDDNDRRSTKKHIPSKIAKNQLIAFDGGLIREREREREAERKIGRFVLKNKKSSIPSHVDSQ
jgi:predicted GNAT family N-acyltransferase